ncbi:MAG TPA: ribose 1,5-bisphosphate isomerase [Armatimonadetes bacterium]|jgi:thiamine thiazole synthase|nr:ribose 1,5-bisphosphate isomerase [Armatimonadota bacterium]
MGNSVSFSSAGEKDITRAILRSFAEQLDEYVESEVVIVGGGPSGLMAGMGLARAGRKVLLIERNNYLGGGFWIGGYLMNKLTVRAPAHLILDDLGIPYDEATDGLYVADGPHACSKLIAAACDAGLRILSMTTLDDVVLRKGGRVAGVVVNWTPVNALPRQITCVDPIALETQLVIDATGHDACILRRLRDRGLVELPDYGSMDVAASEDAVVEYTGQVFPGLMVCGMAVATAHGLARMGPTFGAMLESGKKATAEALAVLERERTRVRDAAPVA